MNLAGPVFTEWYWGPIFFVVFFGPFIVGGAAVVTALIRWNMVRRGRPEPSGERLVWTFVAALFSLAVLAMVGFLVKESVAP